MKKTEIPEAMAATLIHLLPKEKISISDIEDILKNTLLIFKSIPLDIPKPNKQHRGEVKRNECSGKERTAFGTETH